MNTIIKLCYYRSCGLFIAQCSQWSTRYYFLSSDYFCHLFGALNLFVKPILHLFSFPITLLTLKLFALVINAIIILLADHFTDGIQIDGFWWPLFSVLSCLLLLLF